MPAADFWIERLGLEAHPEGGFYRETYRSGPSYDFSDAGPFRGPRNYATAIHYLLKTGERSRLHRIHSDELWFFHAGEPLDVHVFPPDGPPSSFTLGCSPDRGELLQAAVAAESWFGACHPLQRAPEEGYSLVSCVVAPGFDFRDFSFAAKEPLLEKYPEFSAIIDRLC
ncbi:cupin domain-containing protein [Chlorobium sp.]|jgi:predicted cupin superfamily sugar epimerase|uniref:cupin domain-containing protein n=1 Tax=Chlorobium sp. TaxID=1095 RepID=UPI003C4F409E|nr:cupin domain-containing protein [Chlorobiaceae bacterium]